MNLKTWLPRLAAWPGVDPAQEGRVKQDRYDRELAAWQDEVATIESAIVVLKAQVIQKSSFVPPSDVPIMLRKGEGVIWVVHSAALIEPKRQSSWSGSSSGVSFRLMKGVRYHVGRSSGQSTSSIAPARQALGTVTITDQRLVFQSTTESREWAFSKLLGFQHDVKLGSPLLGGGYRTYIQVSNRQRVSGIEVDAAHWRLWCFRLSLAVARFRDEVPELLAQWQEYAKTQEAAKPSFSTN